jgi:hypothetical protein
LFCVGRAGLESLQQQQKANDSFLHIVLKRAFSKAAVLRTFNLGKLLEMHVLKTHARPTELKSLKMHISNNLLLTIPPDHSDVG